jgi:hypothetical protein
MPEYAQILRIGKERPDVDIVFIEPNRKACDALQKELPNATVVWGAVVNDDCQEYWVQFVDMQGSQINFVKGVHAPIHAHHDRDKCLRKAKTILVPAVTMKNVDDGTIDVLHADCEGAEWFVLQGLHSRPKVLSLEIGSASNQNFKNQYHDEIMHWLQKNQYKHWYNCDSDQVFKYTP